MKSNILGKLGLGLVNDNFLSTPFKQRLETNSILNNRAADDHVTLE